jgi:hypothetical protein
MENEQSGTRPEIRNGQTPQGSDPSTTPPSPPNPDQQGPVNLDNLQLNDANKANTTGLESGAGT